MEINFTIPNKYVERIKTAFGVTTEEKFKDKIRQIVKGKVKIFEEEEAVKEARESIVIEEDLIS